MSFLPILSAAMILQGSQVPAQHLPVKPLPGKVVARVNGVEIKASEVEPLLWDWRGQEVIDDLVTYQLIRGEAHRNKIKLTELEVLKSLDDQLTAMKQTLPKDKDLDAALREQGFPKSRLYISVKSDLLLQKLTDLLFDPKAFVKVSTMAFKPTSAASADLTTAITKADDALARLAKGETWESVLATTQDNPGLVEAKGFLGWKQLEAFPEAIRADVAQAKAGLVTKPVQTPAGIQFFRIDALGGEAAEQDLTEIRRMYLQEAKPNLLQKLRKAAKIELLLGKG